MSEQDAGGGGEVDVVEVEADVLVGDAGVEDGLDAEGAVDFAESVLRRRRGCGSCACRGRVARWMGPPSLAMSSLAVRGLGRGRWWGSRRRRGAG